MERHFWLRAGFLLAVSLSVFSCAKQIGNRDTDNSSGKSVKPASLPGIPRKDSLETVFFFDPSDPNTDKVISGVLKPLNQRLGDKLRWDFAGVAWGRTEADRAKSRLVASSVACAQKQGKPLEFLKSARKSIASFSESVAIDIAGRIGLKISEFQQCIRSPSSREVAAENENKASHRLIRTVPAVAIEDAVIYGLSGRDETVKPEVYERVANAYLNGPDKDTVTLYVFYDPTCKVCAEEISHAIVTTYDNVVPVRIPVDRPENKSLALSLGIDRTPAYAFRGPVKTLKDYSRIEKLLRPLRGPKDMFEVEVSFSVGIRKFLIPLPRMREDHVLGSPDAPVTIYDFSDFQCPACRNLALGVLPEFKREMIDTGKVRWSYVHFPLVQGHEYAFTAAVGSECAARQGKFWEYHDLIFMNQSSLSRQLIFNLAAQIPGLSSEKFASCMNDKKAQDIVSADLAIAEKLKFPGTPTLIVGPYITGSRSVAELIFLVNMVAEEQTASSSPG